MKQDGSGKRCGAVALFVCAAAWMLGAVPATAQLGEVLGIRASTNVFTVDEFGQYLQGTPNAWPADGDLVMFLWASNNVIYPPIDVNGTPDPGNAPVVDFEFWTNGITWIGIGGTAGITPPSFYDVSASNTVRYNTDRWVFARVFNAHTPTGASFYGDSQLEKIPSDGPITFVVYRTDKPLDTGDNDGDGLNNSMEKSLGTDPDDQHSDDDGVNDYEEWVAGTDGRNSESVFILARLRQGVGGDAMVAWDSVAGKRYELYYTTDPLDATDPAPVWTRISGDTPITASGALTEVPVTSGFASGRGFYRVRVLRNDE